MKKSFKFLGLAFCVLSVTLAGKVLATPSEKSLDNLEEQADQPTEMNMKEKDFHMAFLSGDFELEMVSMEAGMPISTLLLFISGPEGKIIKDAQVITTIIDQQGNQDTNRAQPFKGGYMIAVNHLPIGQYRVEAEVVTDGQLLTEEFQFNKA